MAREGSDFEASLADTRPMSELLTGHSKLAPTLPSEMLEHPRYEFLQLLGAGGMGVVYKAQHRYMERPVAIKLINSMLLGNTLLSEPGIVKRFRDEVRAAARLTHPNIVHAYDAEEWRGTHFLVMEYVQGADLDRILAREDRLSVSLACRYIRQAALGMEYAFQRGMIHLDIKPHNLMVDQAGQIKILDFGLARFVGQTMSQNAWEDAHATPQHAGAYSTHLGTADYMAPELIRDPRRADIRSDIYSLGCTMHRLLTGRVLCPGDTIADILDCHRAGRRSPWAAAWPDLPPQLAETLRRMLAVDPRDRLQTPSDVAEALQPFAQQSRRKVLVVDDDATTRWALERLLAAQGCDVVAAGNGQEALDALAAHEGVNLILLDLEMPVMDGWHFLQNVKRHADWAAIPVVIVSSEAPRNELAGDAGATASLRKPVHVDRLLSAINSPAIAGHAASL